MTGSTGLRAFHVTALDRLDSIYREGFRRSGDLFGRGVYLGLEEDWEAAVEFYLERCRMFDGDPVIIEVELAIARPFEVVLSYGDLTDPAAAVAAVVGDDPTGAAGAARRLGYDSLIVRDPGFTTDVGGDQIVVADPALIRIVSAVTH